MPSDFKQEEANTIALNFYKAYIWCICHKHLRERGFQQEDSKEEGMQNHSPVCLCRATQVTADRFKQTQPVASVLVGNSQKNWRHCSPEMVLGAGFSEPSPLPGSRKSQNTRVCCSRDTTDTPCPCSTLSKCPNQEMLPAHATISQVSPYLILPYCIIFCLLHWVSVRLETAQHAAVINQTMQHCC